MSRRFVLIVLTLLCGLANAQVRQNDTSNNSSAPVKAEAPKALPAGSQETTDAAVDPKTYVIGSEDLLYVRVWREPDFTGPLAVRPDGKITIPLVGDMQAAGLTPVRLADQLKQALSDYINKPDVTVTLAQVNSKKYFITGGVNRSGEFPLVLPTRVFDALSNAGGFRDFANKKKIVIVRGAQRLKFNYVEVLKGKNLDQNIFLENGDTIVVPE